MARLYIDVNAEDLQIKVSVEIGPIIHQLSTLLIQPTTFIIHSNYTPQRWITTIQPLVLLHGHTIQINIRTHPDHRQPHQLNLPNSPLTP
jgi:hypothetical protein